MIFELDLQSLLLTNKLPRVKLVGESIAPLSAFTAICLFCKPMKPVPDVVLTVINSLGICLYVGILYAV